MDYKWEFAPDDEGSGLVESSGKHFKNTPLFHMVRETIQNAKDASAEENGKVTVTFEKSLINGSDIPDVEGMRNAINASLNTSPSFLKAGQDTILKRIIKDTKNKQLPLLRIMEEGTRGMEGPCTPLTDLYRYIKSTSLGKNNAESLGSQGEGKGAALINSDLNTIFVSTICKGKSHVMGRLSIASSKRNGVVYSSKGYWGKDRKDVPFQNGMPNWLKRDTQGTNICILGFRNTRDWPEIIIASAIMSYFMAFRKNTLEVRVKNENGKLVHKVDKDNIADYFEDKKIEEAVRKSDDLRVAIFRDSRAFYYASLQAPKKSQTNGLGQIALYLYETEDDESRRIGFVRGDMFITNKVPKMGGQIPNIYRPHTILIDFEDKEGAKKIKDMEPPQHNVISVDELDDSSLKPDYRNYLRELKNKIIDYLDKYLRKDDAKSGRIFELPDWLTVEGESGKNSNETNPKGRFKFELIGPINKIPPLPKPLTRKKTEKKLAKKPVTMSQFRYFKVSDDEAEISFSASYTGPIEAVISERGADIRVTRTLSFIESNLGFIKDENSLILDVEDDKIVNLKIKTQETGFKALTLSLFEVNDGVL